MVTGLDRLEELNRRLKVLLENPRPESQEWRWHISATLRELADFGYYKRWGNQKNVDQVEQRGEGMSGGRWNYQDTRLIDIAEDLPLMLGALQKMFHHADWALCGDTSRETAKHLIWNELVALGNELWP